MSDSLINLSQTSSIYKIETGHVTGYFCRLSGRWIILAGSKISMSPTNSLMERENYALAWKNYQIGKSKCDDKGVLQDDFEVPSGSESQCMTIILGTPSSSSHCENYLTTIDFNDADHLKASRDRLRAIQNETDVWGDEESSVFSEVRDRERATGDGIVYLLASCNPKYDGLVKIGMTRRALTTRVDELANEVAGLYSQCEVLFQIRVSNPNTVEKGLHYLFSQQQSPISFEDGTAEEWFCIDWQAVESVMEIVAGQP